MKKSSALATLATSLFLSSNGVHAQAAASVQVYGLLDVGITYVSQLGGNGSAWFMHPGAMQGSRWGLRGTEDMGGGLKALFVLESGLNLNTGGLAQGGLAWGRRAVVGLEGSLGTVLFGRQPDFLDDLGAMTSTLDFGSQVAGIHALDRTNTQRANNSIRYNSVAVGGWSLTAMLGLGSSAASTVAGATRSIGVSYRQGDLRVAGGYHESRAATGTASTSADAGYGSIGAVPGATNVTGKPGDVVLRTSTLATTYRWGTARLHASVSTVSQPLAAAGGRRALGSSSHRQSRIVDLGGSVAVAPATQVSASVIRNDASFSSAADAHVTQVNLGIDHVLSKRTDVYLNTGYQTTSGMVAPGLESASGESRSQFLARVGVRHKF